MHIKPAFPPVCATVSEEHPRRTQLELVLHTETWPGHCGENAVCSIAWISKQQPRACMSEHARAPARPHRAGCSSELGIRGAPGDVRGRCRLGQGCFTVFPSQLKPELALLPHGGDAFSVLTNRLVRACSGPCCSSGRCDVSRRGE